MLCGIGIHVDRTCLKDPTGRSTTSILFHPASYMNLIAVAFVGSVLAIELIEFGFWPVELFGIAEGNKADIDNTENGLEGIRNLGADELSTIRAEGFVVESEVHSIIVVGANLPNKTIALFGHLCRGRSKRKR
jgi:hypothetical protein